MTFNFNRERIRKEQDANNTTYQSTTKYQQESKSTGEWVVPKELIEQYISCPDKTEFLHKYGRCVFNEV